MRKSVVGVCRVVRVLLVAGEFVSIQELLDVLFRSMLFSLKPPRSASRVPRGRASDVRLTHCSSMSR